MAKKLIEPQRYGVMKRYEQREISRYLFLGLLILFVLSINGWSICAGGNDTADDNPLNWLTYEQALAKSKIEHIPTLIYFYSDHCGWCRKLENETFTNQQIRELMSQSFALSKINSDSGEWVVEDGKKITQKDLSDKVYQVRGNPTIWFLGKDNEPIASLPGFVEAEMLNYILRYIKEEQYKDVTFQEYMEQQDKRS